MPFCKDDVVAKADLYIQLCKMAETPENATGSWGSMGFRRKHLNLYPVELHEKTREVSHMALRRARVVTPQSVECDALTTTFSSPSSVACVQLGIVTLNCHPLLAIMNRTECASQKCKIGTTNTPGSLQTLHLDI